MNTFKKYIEMCEKATEIQNQKPDINDSSGQIFICRICRQTYIEDNGYNYCGLHIGECKNPIWLPNQNQLQELLKDKNYTVYGLFENMLKWMSSSKNIVIDWSMEQLWLGFVMEERFNRIWNGNDWEKISCGKSV